jgi:hypothetical protein
MAVLSTGSLRKQDVFNSREEAREHLAGRRVFSTMAPEVFNIFIDECLVPYNAETEKDTQHTQTQKDDDKDKEKDREAPRQHTQVQLLCRKQDEAEVYHRVPYEIPILSKEILNQYGMHTSGKFYFTRQKNTILEPADCKWVANKFKNLKCQEFHHSHFWPLEHVDDFSTIMAEDIVDILVSDSTQ